MQGRLHFGGWFVPGYWLVQGLITVTVCRVGVFTFHLGRFRLVELQHLSSCSADQAQMINYVCICENEKMRLQPLPFAFDFDFHSDTLTL